LQDSGTVPIDTTPLYPRPRSAGVEAAKLHICQLAEFFAPDTNIIATFIVRAVMARGASTAEAMWGLHELCLAGAIEAVEWASRHDRLFVTEGNPPAGLVLLPASGRLHVDNEKNETWAYLVLRLNHQCLAALQSADPFIEPIENEAVRANTQKLFPKGMPSNPDVCDLVVRLQTEQGNGKSMNQIAREFTGEPAGQDRKAKSLLAQIRRMKGQGEIVL
jgi:hypothetical protein